MEDREYGAITVGLDGHVATITLNNPERKNALSPRMVNELLYALDDQCSHADTPLSEGRLHGHALSCPRHGTSFDVRTGGLEILALQPISDDSGDDSFSVIDSALVDDEVFALVQLCESSGEGLCAPPAIHRRDL